MPAVQTRICTPADVPALLPGLIEVYRAAFAGPPHHEREAEVERFHDRQLPAHVERSGFVLLAATVDEQVGGFVYGYTGQRGQYWSDLVVRSVPRELADEWVGGHFEVVTLAVAPSAQRHGVGARLMTELLEAVPHSRALLGGPLVDSPARRLYRRLGWVELGDLGDYALFGLAR